jgi:hypothetical protein
MRGEYLSRSELLAGLTVIAEGMVQIVRSSKLSRHEQDDMLHHIASLGTVFEDVGKRQSRLRPEGLNGASSPNEAVAQAPKKRGRPKKVRAETVNHGN